jgi:hypothetical protein
MPGLHQAPDVGCYFWTHLAKARITYLMTQISSLILGGVYLTKWDERPFRVLAFDDFQVYYDCFWPTLGTWTFGNIQRKGYYYSMTPQRFLEDSKFVRQQPLTAPEFQIFRPDLPLRMCCNKFLSWTDQAFLELEKYIQYIKSRDVIFDDTIVLPITEIVLHPYGPQSGAVKPSVITSRNKEGFNCLELLWNAHNIQSVHIRDTQKIGVGIFRLGHEKKMPAYYIGNYYD